MIPRSVAIVSGVFPYPTDNGKKAVLAGLIQYFVDRIGGEHIHYVHVGPSVPEHVATAFQLVRISPPSLPERVSSIVRHVFTERRKSYQEALVYSRRVARELARVLGKLRPAAVLYDTVRFGQYHMDQPLHESAAILYMDDLFSVRYRRMLEEFSLHGTNGVDPLGNFGDHLPSIARWIARRAVVGKRLLEYERAAIRKAELAAPRHFDTTLLVNREEADSLRAETSHRVETLTPWIGDPRGRGRRFTGEPLFVFVGALNVPHNAYSIQRFLRAHADRIIQNIPDVRIMIIGRGASDALRAAVAKYGNHVHLMGYVDDLGEVMSRACCVIVPLVFGSGVKIKTLEALGYGVPVIATEFGIEGIADRGGPGCIVADLDEFPDRMAEVLDFRRNEEMSTAAREFFETRYSKAVVYSKYDELFESLL